MHGRTSRGIWSTVDRVTPKCLATSFTVRTWPSGEEVTAIVCWRWNVTAAKEIAAGKEPNSFLDVRDRRRDLSGSPNMVDRERALSVASTRASRRSRSPFGCRGTS
jgi:hypothetical protein